ncbi:MAG TPA: hypothetical protein VGJ26_19250 [Pirellulales bacterium]|jgi:hypothetical protein
MDVILDGLTLLGELLVFAFVGVFKLWCSFFVWILRRHPPADEEADREANNVKPLDEHD